MSLSYLEDTLVQLPEEVAQRLSLLVDVAQLLRIEDATHFLSYSNALSRLSQNSLEAKRTLARLDYIESELRAHLAEMKHEERLISKWKLTMNEEYPDGEDSRAVLRRRDAVLRKAKEYKTELDQLQAETPQSPSVTIGDLATQQEANRQREHAMKTKRAKLKAFQGLSPNPDLARAQLRDAQDEQTRLIGIREQILAKMADSVV
ncbi:uncharacterized protein SCHCODRAFT_02645013 [Schizophyllum commune H4-8]|uniref:Expressed protein n=1 Tax=Schizophyllum commune (strain H4-8 / FGSC 9210) TaxID=578458 RepID=D8QKD7_SCHCM|nr:uncharacterized protein SCHCODRAFT_02645013 [Schizophyllum commune H4-8]KAI5885070.1 hypothetical protein SCHCODRAFT_02645013 [Schizophyllum commune H4-8]